MSTMHDLRVSLRDKMKIISELELKIEELKAEINRKDAIIYDYENKLKKKEDVISMKDLIIKEKDVLILKLENNLRNLTLNNNVNEANEDINEAIDYNHLTINDIKTTITLPIENQRKSRSLTPAPATLITTNNGEHSVTLTLPPPKLNRLPAQTLQPLQHLSKAKRVAISAEPAQVYKKSKDLKTYLKEYEKSEEYANMFDLLFVSRVNLSLLSF